MFINEHGEDEYVYLSKATPFDVKIEKIDKGYKTKHYYIYFRNLGSENSVRIGIYKKREDARADLQKFMTAFLDGNETVFTFKKEA